MRIVVMSAALMAEWVPGTQTHCRRAAAALLESGRLGVRGLRRGDRLNPRTQPPRSEQTTKGPRELCRRRLRRERPLRSTARLHPPSPVACPIVPLLARRCSLLLLLLLSIANLASFSLVQNPLKRILRSLRNDGSSRHAQEAEEEQQGAAHSAARIGQCRSADEPTDTRRKLQQQRTRLSHLRIPHIAPPVAINQLVINVAQQQCPWRRLACSFGLCSRETAAAAGGVASASLARQDLCAEEAE